MSDMRKSLARSALPRIAAWVAFGYLNDSDEAFWRREVLALLPDLDSVPAAMVPLKRVVEEWAEARDPDERRNRLSRMGYEVAVYFGKAAGAALADWRGEGGGRA